jgi:hypothetical protein
LKIKVWLRVGESAAGAICCAIRQRLWDCLLPAGQGVSIEPELATQMGMPAL